MCVVPGEVWNEVARDYFLALEEGINRFPGFAPEVQGVHIVEQADGSRRAFGYVVR
jgi:ornithine decarboxylase